jgi:hypothetical protein
MSTDNTLDLGVEDRVAPLLFRHLLGNRLTRSMVHALVVAGANGKDFCADFVIQEWAALSLKDSQAEIQPRFEALWAFEHLSKPTTAAIEGTCRSLGVELALACDLRIASDSVRFFFPDVDRAGRPSHSGTARLTRTVERSPMERSLKIVTLKGDAAMFGDRGQLPLPGRVRQGRGGLSRHRGGLSVHRRVPQVTRPLPGDL